jgi:hypothetical protein
MQASVTKVSQLELGGWYIVRGTDSSGLPIPPQLFRLEAMDQGGIVQGQPIVRGTLWVKALGMIRRYSEHSMPLWMINIPETGLTDHVLVRIPAAKAPTALEDSYHEVIQHRVRHQPVVESRIRQLWETYFA